MSELEIKVALIKRIVDDALDSRRNLLINEFTNLNCGVRADLAILSQECLSAFEIKSRVDTTKRLKGQLDKYDLYFDRYVVVVTENHLKSVSSILKSTRSGLWLYTGGDFKVLKKGRKRRVPDGVIQDYLLPSGDRSKGLSPRERLFTSLLGRYGQNMAEIEKIQRNGTVSADDIKRLNPHFLRRESARRVAIKYEEMWVGMSKVS